MARRVRDRRALAVGTMRVSAPGASAAGAVRRRGAARAALWTLCALATACGAPDAMPRAPADAPPGRLADSLLERPALQAVAEATLARDGRALIAALDDEDPFVRARAAYGLASVQDAAARTRLLELLHDVEPRVREDAAFALGQLPGGADMAAVAAIADERDARVRRALVEAVGKQGGTAAIDELSTITEPTLLAETTLALSRAVVRQVASDGVVDTLVARMVHPEARVRAAATYFVARGETTTRWYPRFREITRAMAGYSRADEAAMHILAGLGRGVSMFAAEPVGVSWLANSPDWRIRANAALAVGALYEVRTDAGEALVRALDDPSPHVRARAAEALADAPGGPDLRGRLAERVQVDPADASVAGPLVGTLARSGHLAAVRAHLAHLPAHDVSGWRQTAAVIEELPGPVAVELLGYLLALPNTPEPVAADAAATLVEFWGLARDTPEAAAAFLPVVAGAVGEAPPRRAAPLAVILADAPMLDLGTAEHLSELLDRLRAGPVRDTLVEALAASPDPRARALVDAPPVVASDTIVERGALGPGGGDEATSDTATASTMDSVEESPDARPVLAVDWPALQALGTHPRLVLETERGRVVVVLRTEEAPLTVQAVTTLAREGRYDGVPFHRVVPNFVVQGGDVARGDGSGGPAFVLRSEFTRTPYQRGVVGMASSGKDTEGSQYFITHSPQWHLDGGWTAFGWVEQGMDVVDRIVRGDRVLRATVVPGR